MLEIKSKPINASTTISPSSKLHFSTMDEALGAM
jgi:hypothetical protein